MLFPVERPIQKKHRQGVLMFAQASHEGSARYCCEYGTNRRRAPDAAPLAEHNSRVAPGRKAGGATIRPWEQAQADRASHAAGIADHTSTHHTRPQDR